MPGRAHLWEVSWLPGHRLDRNSAITAMVLADLTGPGDASPGGPPVDLRRGLVPRARAPVQTTPSSGSPSRPRGRPLRVRPTGKPANDPVLSGAIAEGTAAAPRAGLHRGRGRGPAARRPRQGLPAPSNRAAPKHQDREIATNHRSAPGRLRRLSRRQLRATSLLPYKRNPLRSAAQGNRRIRKGLAIEFKRYRKRHHPSNRERSRK